MTSSKKPMGFRLECEDCEEPELTDVQDGQHNAADRVYSPHEIAEAFYDLVVKLRAMGAESITALDCGVAFPEGSKPIVPKTVPKKGTKS